MIHRFSRRMRSKVHSLTPSSTPVEPQGISLDRLAVGERAAVQRIAGGRAVAQRLLALGVTPGVELEMVQNYGRGPLIISVRGARLALGRGEAARIMVQTKSE